LVKQLGCDKGQGYFYARPLSAADLVLWLTRNQRPTIAQAAIDDRTLELDHRAPAQAVRRSANPDGVAAASL